MIMFIKQCFCPFCEQNILVPVILLIHFPDNQPLLLQTVQKAYDRRMRHMCSFRYVLLRDLMVLIFHKKEKNRELRIRQPVLIPIRIFHSADSFVQQFYLKRERCILKLVFLKIRWFRNHIRNLLPYFFLIRFHAGKADLRKNSYFRTCPLPASGITCSVLHVRLL